MNTQKMTQQDIRVAGVGILGKHMGMTGMIRFLQQDEIGHGDYTAQRDRLLGQPSLDALIAEIQSSECNTRREE